MKPDEQKSQNPKTQTPKPPVVTFGFDVEPMPTLVVDKPPMKIDVPKEIVEKIVEKMKEL